MGLWMIALLLLLGTPGPEGAGGPLDPGGGPGGDTPSDPVPPMTLQLHPAARLVQRRSLLAIAYYRYY